MWDGERVGGAMTRKGQKNVVAAEDEVVWTGNRINSQGLESRLLMAVCGAGSGSGCLRRRPFRKWPFLQRLSRRLKFYKNFPMHFFWIKDLQVHRHIHIHPQLLPHRTPFSRVTPTVAGPGQVGQACAPFLPAAQAQVLPQQQQSSCPLPSSPSSARATPRGLCSCCVPSREKGSPCAPCAWSYRRPLPRPPLHFPLHDRDQDAAPCHHRRSVSHAVARGRPA